MCIIQSSFTHANTLFNYKVKRSGAALVNSVSRPHYVLRDEIIHPHEFVLIYQEHGVNNANWANLLETIRSRLSTCSLDFTVLDIQQEQDQRKIVVVHKDAYRIVESMVYEGVVCEFNLQQIIEFGFAPVLIHYIELLGALNSLEKVMKTGYLASTSPTAEVSFLIDEEVSQVIL